MKNYAGRTAGRAAGQVTAGRGGLRAMMWQHFAVRADCGPSYCGAGRAAGSDFQPAQGLNRYTHKIREE